MSSSVGGRLLGGRGGVGGSEEVGRAGAMDETQSQGSSLTDSQDDDIEPCTPTINVSRMAFDQSTFESAYGFEDASERSLRGRLRQTCECNGAKLVKALVGLVPILHWLPRYDFRAHIFADAVAGITVGIMHIPQGMAYASLAGLEPVYGLYTSFFPSLIYMFFGTSRHVSLGVFAVVSLMVGATRFRLLPDVPESPAPSPAAAVANGTADALGSTAAPPLAPIEVVTALTLTVGIVLLIMAFLRLGFLTAYLSDQVIKGFTTGAACHVFTAQLNKIMGVPLPRYDGLFRLAYMYRDFYYDVPSASLPTVLVSVATAIILLFGKELVNAKMKKYCAIPIPFELVVVILGTACSFFWRFEEQYHMKVVEHIPTGIPPPVLPHFELIPQLLADAIGIAIVVFVVTVSMGKLFAKRHNYRVDADQELVALAVITLLIAPLNCHPASASLTRSSVMSAMGAVSQELLALGIMEVICSLFSVYPASTALARTLVYESAGAKTQLATVFSCSLLLVVLLWIGPLFSPLPMCILGSIIIVALKGMFLQVLELPKLWRVSKIDFLIWVVSFLATVLWDVKQGLAIGVIFALLTVIFRSQRPTSTVVGNLPGSEMYREMDRFKTEQIPGVAIFRFDSQLIFTNVDQFRDRLYRKSGVDLEAVRKSRRRRASAAAKKHRLLLATNGDCHHSVQAVDDHVFHADGMANGVAEKPVALTVDSLPSHVIVDCSSINYIDSMGVGVLREVFEELDSIDIVLLYAGCKVSVRDMLRRSTFHETVPVNNFFPSVEDAVAFIQSDDPRIARPSAPSEECTTAV